MRYEAQRFADIFGAARYLTENHVEKSDILYFNAEDHCVEVVYIVWENR